MAKNRFKDRFVGMPAERHNTAAWADIKDTKPVSNVPVPDESGIKNSKEWVEINEK